MSDSYEKLKTQKDAMEWNQRNKVVAPVLSIVDMLAVALADHNHTWTDEQRKAYDSLEQYRTAKAIGGDV